MSKVTFNLKDTSFAHAFSTVGDKTSKYINWDRSCADRSLPTFYTNEQIFNCDTSKEKSYGILYESKALIKDVYKKAPKVMNRFQNIFTYDPDLLKLNPAIFKLIPGGGIWIGSPLGGGTIEIKPKSKLVSMVSSKKRSCSLHRFRYRLAKKLTPAKIVDVYGMEQWTHICNTLDDYMFSIVIENNAIENYFTEKLLNCFAVGTVPIYLGCRNIDSFFDPKGIIPIGRWTNIKRLVAGLTHESYYSRMDAIRRNHDMCKQYEILEDFIYEKYFLRLPINSYGQLTN
ncbi:MAG: glycosyltransferase family 10 domain-containing protein [Smithellaceae bacterium]